MSVVNLGHWENVSKGDWAWENFTPFELRHRFDDIVYVNMDFLDKVQTLRHRVGFPLQVSSYYRSPEYNAQISSTGPSGPHVSGLAIDLLVSGKKAHELLRVALRMDFTGIGISQKGPHPSRFIHLDMLEGDNRPWVWGY